MARPIKETPILTGKDARRFEQELKANENNKVTRESYDRAMSAFQDIKQPQNKQLGT
jgi:hypothetical protein